MMFLNQPLPHVHSKILTMPAVLLALFHVEHDDPVLILFCFELRCCVFQGAKKQKIKP